MRADDDPPPPPRRPEPPPKPKPAPRTTKAAAPPKPPKVSTTTTKPVVRPPPPAPIPSTSTVPYCECGYPALETSVILAQGPPCKRWGCGNMGRCEFFQVDQNPVPAPLIPQKRPPSDYVRVNPLFVGNPVSLLSVEPCQEGREPAMSLHQYRQTHGDQHREEVLGLP